MWRVVEGVEDERGIAADWHAQFLYKFCEENVWEGEAMFALQQQALDYS